MKAKSNKGDAQHGRCVFGVYSDLLGACTEKTTQRVSATAKIMASLCVAKENTGMIAKMR
jgi:hypothetical protein